MFNKKEKEQKSIEKKILNAKIFEYHKDLRSSSKEIQRKPMHQPNSNEVEIKEKYFYSLKDMFSRDIAMIEDKVFKIVNIYDG